MMKKLMLGVSISALMLGGAFAQSSMAPSSTDQFKPRATAPAEPSAATPAAKPTIKWDMKSAAKPESDTHQSNKTKSDNQATAITDNKAAGGQPKVVASQSPDQFLASNFKGTDVIGSNGKKIGDVADILFEKDGTIKAYVISFGGFLGMGAKEVAIAPNAFEVMPGKKGGAKKLKLSMSQRDLKSAQKFTEYQPPKPTFTTGSGTGSMRAPRPSGGGMAPSTR
jgi:sporulation protein YlmC with PRC-barrel domain